MLNDEFKRVNRELIPGEVERAALASEMTGIIPAEIESEPAARSYEELTPMHGQKPAKEEDSPQDGR